MHTLRLVHARLLVAVCAADSYSAALHGGRAGWHCRSDVVVAATVSISLPVQILYGRHNRLLVGVGSEAWKV